MLEVKVGDNLSLEILFEVLKGKAVKLILTDEVKEKVLKGRKIIENILSSDRAVYGVNTGFGSLATSIISNDELDKLQENLIKSHDAGAYPIMPKRLCKLAFLIRINTLATGHSGIRLELLEQLIDLFNKDIIPAIPAKGSLGASGDLAPLAALVSALMKKGLIWQKEELLEAEILDFKPITLKAKEGLALINGTPVTASVLVEVLYRFWQLFKLSLIVSALSLEAYKGHIYPFLEKVHELKPFNYQKQVARIIVDLLENSQLINWSREHEFVQDPYSFRCVPQVLGACGEVINRLQDLLTIEINSVTDNPLVFFDGDVISGGHFHAEMLGFFGENLKLALTEMASISEKRLNNLITKSMSRGLPPFLIENSGVNSGFMIAHYTVAALLNEMKVLATPSLVDTIPTSAGQEDHVSLANNTARIAHKISENCERILVTELLADLQALKLRLKEKKYKLSRPAGILLEDFGGKLFLEEDNNIRYYIDYLMSKKDFYLEKVFENVGNLLA